MGYTEKSISSGEQIIQKAIISKSVMVPTIIIAAIIFLVLAIFGLWFVGLILAAIIILPKYIKIKSTELSLTNKKILGKAGILSTKVMDSPLNKINNISVQQSLSGKICGYGKLVISTSSGNYNFDYIKQPDIFRNSIMAQVDEYENEKIRRQAEELARAIK